MQIHCKHWDRLSLFVATMVCACSNHDNAAADAGQGEGGRGQNTTQTGGQLTTTDRSSVVTGGVLSGGSSSVAAGGTSSSTTAGITGGAGATFAITGGTSGTAESSVGNSAGNGTGNTAGNSAGTGTASSAGAAGSGNADRLSQTGLFESDMKTLRADVIPFTPRFELWSDGATKRRWLYLPPGTTIDTSDPDYWKLPVGTKVWKEFSKNGKRIETRLVERVSSRNYRMIAYLWSEDLSDAVAVPNGMPAALGTDHDVPNATDCETCHNNQPGRFIGVSALQLDYDYTGLTVAKLQAEGRLSQPVPSAALLPGDATAKAALGILHVNCGTCHNPNSTLPYKTLDLFQRVGMLSDVTATPFYLSAVGVASGTNPDVTGPATIVVPGHPEQSALIYRMNTRTAKIAMPPLASKQIDSAAVDTVSKFIAGLK